MKKNEIILINNFLISEIYNKNKNQLIQEKDYWYLINDKVGIIEKLLNN